MSSCAFHLHTCSSHASEHFPRCPALLRHPVSLSTSFRVWGLNISGLDRDFPSGLGLLPVDRLSSFGSFGLRLILQRLTEGPERPRVCCSPTPPQIWPKTHQTLLHVLERSITIVWPKTEPSSSSAASPIHRHLHTAVPPASAPPRTVLLHAGAAPCLCSPPASRRPPPPSIPANRNSDSGVLRKPCRFGSEKNLG